MREVQRAIIQSTTLLLLLLLLVPVRQATADFSAGQCRSTTCGEPQPKKKCDQNLIDEYERKKAVGLELMRHSRDLDLAAQREIGEFLGMEAKRYGGDVAFDIGTEQAWQYGSHLAKQYMKGERAAWVAKLAQYGPAAELGMFLGGYLTFVDGAYRAYDIARRYRAYQEESRRAAEDGQRLLKEALEAFKADLAQAPECLEESRKAADEEKLLDQAKEHIEEWQNNGHLYFDPITKEAVVYEQALKRAKQRLQASSQGAVESPLRPVRFITAAGTAEVFVTKGQLEAAIKDLGEALQSFDRLSPRVAKYLQWQTRIHVRLETLEGSLSR